VNGNFRVIDNTLVTSADYGEYCVTSPSSGLLPGGGGQQLCGLYDINPNRFGLNRNVITNADNFGEQRQVYNGVDFVSNARLPNSISFQGGLNVGRIETNNCFVVDSPQQLRFCDVRPPFLTQVKLQGIFPLKWWGLQTSVAFQSVPGPQILANWSAPAAGVTGLGRPLSGGARTVAVNLVQPGTLYGDRLNQTDFRVSKVVTVGRSRFEGILDLYNLFNSNVVLTMNNTYGANWLQPLTILPGRLAKVAVRINY
jgi:hypothetical protein